MGSEADAWKDAGTQTPYQFISEAARWKPTLAPQPVETLRDKFAMAALTGLLSDVKTIEMLKRSKPDIVVDQVVCMAAYDVADFMMSERNANAATPEAACNGDENKT